MFAALFFTSSSGLASRLGVTSSRLRLESVHLKPMGLGTGTSRLFRSALLDLTQGLLREHGDGRKAELYGHGLATISQSTRQYAREHGQESTIRLPAAVINHIYNSGGCATGSVTILEGDPNHPQYGFTARFDSGACHTVDSGILGVSPVVSISRPGVGQPIVTLRITESPGFRASLT